MFPFLLVTALAPTPALTQPPAPPPATYANPDLWACLPNRADDACARSNQAATILQANGTQIPAPFHPAPNPPIDCFYIYPTVSTEPSGNASRTLTPQVATAIGQQFARFASVCRPFAPLYRQITLTALKATLRGHPIPTNRPLAYQDVSDAWAYYLAHFNNGRGVALIGHSQGAVLLARLAQDQIDGTPLQHRLLSIILAGYHLQVPINKTAGGDFKSIPLCTADGQTGCAINFASFRATSPPPANSRFGNPAGPGLQAACTNPANLAGGPAPLHAFLSATRQAVTQDHLPPIPWTSPPEPIPTPFAEVPGLLTAECRTTAGRTYLAITIHARPTDRRAADIGGDVAINGHILPGWGLHLIDMNLAMGNLIDLVRRQGDAYTHP